MSKTAAPRVRTLNLYTVEQDGQPVAQAMAISQADAVRLYVESVQQPTMSARLSSPLEARALAGLPLLRREPAAADTKTADLFEDMPAAPVSPVVGAADPLQKLLADAYRLGLNEAGHPGQIVGELAYAMEQGLYITDADAVRAEFVRGCSDAWQRKQEAAATPQGEQVPPASSNATPAVSTSAETLARPANGQPTAAAAVATDAPEKTGDESGPTAASAEVEPHRLTAADSELRRQATSAAARAGGNVVAKYRNPATGETWSGRGLRPRWLVRAIEAGQSQDDFLITA